LSKPGVERRAHARFRKAVKVEGTAGAGDATAMMMATDLSLGGLYCTSTTHFPEMTRLCVRLVLPEADGSGVETHDALDIEAVVVREQKLASSVGNSRYELALYFTRMTDRQRERLARFLAQP
jgi:c-di-GMP-binding flagellar brake protein YcgR